VGVFSTMSATALSSGPRMYGPIANRKSEPSTAHDGRRVRQRARRSASDNVRLQQTQ